MRKIFLSALLLALALTGCASLGTLGEAISLVQKSGANPVTKNDLAEAETAADAVIKALRLYKQACAQGAVDVHCRDNVAKIQAYTRQIPPYRDQLRSFVRTNDQINAVVVYNQLATLISNVKATATGLGVNIGGQ